MCSDGGQREGSCKKRQHVISFTTALRSLLPASRPKKIRYFLTMTACEVSGASRLTILNCCGVEGPSHLFRNRPDPSFVFLFFVMSPLTPFNFFSCLSVFFCPSFPLLPVHVQVMFLLFSLPLSLSLTSSSSPFNSFHLPFNFPFSFGVPPSISFMFFLLVAQVPVVFFHVLAFSLQLCWLLASCSAFVVSFSLISSWRSLHFLSYLSNVLLCHAFSFTFLLYPVVFHSLPFVSPSFPFMFSHNP